MTAEPQVQPLPYRSRSRFFSLLLVIFAISVPVFTFYATGYRISLTDAENIISVGGIFISAETDDTAIYLNDELVENYRLFQRAAYIQNLPAGLHQLHVQGAGVHTWVKQLPVYPHIVTEAQAFNFPAIPQVRLITPYTTVRGLAVVPIATGTTPLPPEVTYRPALFASTTVATSTLEVNPEFEFVDRLFASSTATSSQTLRSRIQAELEDTFTFSTERPTTSTTTRATTTRTLQNRRMYETDDGVFVQWTGNAENAPYFFCVNTEARTASSSPLRAYVAKNVATVTNSFEPLVTRGDFVCRDTIKLTTWERPVYLFDFFPGYQNIALVHLSDGLYAIEIDDRGWQNTQLLYPGEQFTVILEGQQIFIRDDAYLFELLTTLDN